MKSYRKYQKYQKVFSVLVALLTVGLLLSGCSSTPTANNVSNANASTQPVDGGTLTVSSFSDIVTLNPLFIQDTASQDAATFLFANVYDLDRQGNLVVEPWSLAKELPQISADGKTYTVKLKDTAKWSDGQPVTADDLIYTINTIRNPKVGSPGISGYDKVASVKKVNEYTVQVTLKQVYAPFKYYLAAAVVPYHILKDVKAKDLQNNVYGKDPAKTVTDGPWKWSEWKEKQYLSFTRDPNYWGPKPHIAKVIYKIYADQNTEVQALIKGDVDLNTGLPVTALSAVKQKKDIRVILAPGPLYEYLAFNFKPQNFPGNFDPFLGQKTRQAIAYALNRQGMVNDILKGTGRIMNSPFLPGSWADPGSAAVNYPYDPAKAKELLKEDGWTPGPGGILQKDGHRFSFELQFNAGNSRREAVAVVIQQELKNVGIDVKPKAIDFSSWIDQNVNPGKFEALLLAWSLTNPDPDQESIFSSKYFPPAGQNNIWYKNPKLDALWVKGYSTNDQNQRKKIYAEIAKEISTDLPYVFLYQYGTPEGLGPRVHFEQKDRPAPSLAEGYFYHIQNWWVTGK
ncbi:oligopeptide-binding protein AppA precursor [Peptococcaceae bacterium CEB3]|nr:oligopeptide-binding protein AppA precursor [Peptococcaceae bacterium CEB3]